ncbi:MAG: hypothetical protein DWH97_09580 [Planctomycetota bacterium]|nr:MAG: hypothetical protein DWH97_09580 [Planctomycetota bacterium]
MDNRWIICAQVLGEPDHINDAIAHRVPTRLRALAAVTIVQSVERVSRRGDAIDSWCIVRALDAPMWRTASHATKGRHHARSKSTTPSIESHDRAGKGLSRMELQRTA